MTDDGRLNPEEAARHRARKRRQVARAVAWHNHKRVRAAQRITGRPGRAFNMLEAKLAKLFDTWGIDYEWQFRLPPFVYDFRLPNRLLVEAHGSYWHADPRLHPAATLSPNQRRTVVHDIDKAHHAARSGYRLKVAWEHDLGRGEVDRSDFE